jgi:cyclohexadienyl dehydratase
VDIFERQTRSSQSVNRLVVMLAIAALILSIFAVFSHRSPTISRSSNNQIPSLADKLRQTGVLDAGYGVYPPYSIEDPNTKAISGFSVEAINRIAADLKVRVVWHRINWDTFIPDIKRGEFDVIADPIFITTPRALDFTFTEPYDYFGEGIVMLRKDDKRFKSFEDLNKPGLRVAVGIGYASETIAKSYLPNATIIPVQTGTDQLQLFNEVVAGRVDATMSDAGTAKRYMTEHPDLVYSLNLDHPNFWVAGAFALRPNDAEGARVLNVGLEYLRTTGELAALRKKWGLRTMNDITSVPAVK